MPDGEPNEQNPVDPTETGGTDTTGGEPTQETGGTDTTGGEPTQETTEESFPSFRKVYKYRGGFDKWVYDQLKKANGEE